MGFTLGSVLIVYCLGILLIVSKDQGNVFISDVMSLAVSVGGCVGVVFNTGLSILGNVGLGELCVVILEEEKYCLQWSWKMGKWCLWWSWR